MKPVVGDNDGLFFCGTRGIFHMPDGALIINDDQSRQMAYET
jgi:hypothetical protein